VGTESAWMFEKYGRLIS